MGCIQQLRDVKELGSLHISAQLSFVWGRYRLPASFPASPSWACLVMSEGILPKALADFPTHLIGHSDASGPAPTNRWQGKGLA